METAPLDRFITHPDNANTMQPSRYRRLKEQIGKTGRYPPLIVRTLGASTRFKGDKLQILDGHYRFKVLKELKVEKAAYISWGDLDDVRAVQYLATLNSLRGTDDRGKRAGLLRFLCKEMGDTESVAEIVPESVSQIEAAVEYVESPMTEEEVEKASGEFDVWSCMLPDDMRRVINAAVVLRISKGNLPGKDLPKELGHITAEYQKGRALHEICAEYILAHG